ncbi:chaperone NapD [Vibrio astriarenae]
MALNEVHISSIVVHCDPLHLAIIKKQITEYEGAEIYGDSPEGKIVVVLETENQGFITDTIDAINNLPNVLSTVLVYHQIESNSEETELQYKDAGIQHSRIEGEA